MLSGKDRDRLRALHEVRQQHITQREAGEQLGVSERWVRKLLARLRQEGDRGIMHRLRGRTSNRRLAAAIQARAVKLVKSRYSDFGPTLAAEYLEEKHGLRVSQETLRQWLIEAGVWRARGRRVEEVHLWTPWCQLKFAVTGDSGGWQPSLPGADYARSSRGHCKGRRKRGCMWPRFFTKKSSFFQSLPVIRCRQVLLPQVHPIEKRGLGSTRP